MPPLTSLLDRVDHGFLALPSGSLLLLWQTADAKRSHFDYAGQPKPSIFFKTSSMRAVHDALAGAGATITERPESLDPDGQMKFLFFFDPDGNHVGVIDVSVPATATPGTASMG